MIIEKIKELKSKCLFGVYISINEHRDVYQTIDEFISHPEVNYINNDIYNKMIETDTLISITCYPTTPSGCYVSYHYDLEMALENLLNEL